MGALLARFESWVASPRLIDRQTKQDVIEPSPPTKAIRLWLLYLTWLGHLLLMLPVTWLSPSDIHRLHASVAGRVVRIRRRRRRFMGSQAAAVHSRMDIMTENERLVMEFDTEPFGTVVQVMIGASEVGSVQPLVSEGQEVHKGDEVAVFAYGGSIMSTVFGHAAIAFDADLQLLSRQGAETLVTYGSSLGRATGRPHTHAPPAGSSEY